MRRHSAREYADSASPKGRAPDAAPNDPEPARPGGFFVSAAGCFLPLLPAALFQMPHITKANAKELRASQGPRGRARMPYQFRETIRQMLERNAGKFDRWLNEVAEGNEQKGILADPAGALNIITKLAEYAAPKLTRVDIDDDGQERAHSHPVTQIAIQFVDGRAPSAIDTAPILEAPAQVRTERLAAIPAVQIAPPQRIKREKRPA